MRQAGGLHALAKTENGSAFAIALEEQSHHDGSAERKRKRFRLVGFETEKGARYLAFPKSLETFRWIDADRGNQMGSGARITV